ncbi:hypothetical protein F4604DRAFT_1688846 [Suillus subluteus]|nr:hypothetical protein F4604DRAFT_1688846 [Suillus subluteus]
MPRSKPLLLQHYTMNIDMLTPLQFLLFGSFRLPRNTSNIALKNTNGGLYNAVTTPNATGVESLQMNIFTHAANSGHCGLEEYSCGCNEVFLKRIRKESYYDHYLLVKLISEAILPLNLEMPYKALKSKLGFSNT